MKKTKMNFMQIQYLDQQELSKITGGRERSKHSAESQSLYLPRQQRAVMSFATKQKL